MLRMIPFALFAAALHAQGGAKPAEKPPAKVDQALRARVTQFYQDFVNGQFGDAESLVAKDTRDYFVSLRKERYIAFEIQRIDYSDKFSRALVTVGCERNIMVPGFAGRPMKMPEQSAWQLERGKWVWHVDRDEPKMSPFGIMGAAMAAAGGKAPAGGGTPSGQPAQPMALPTVDVALHKVSADKESLALKAGESAQVTFSNSAQGPMTVSLYGVPPDIQVDPVRAELKPDGKAAFTVKALEGAKSLVLNFQIGPTGEFIAIKVVVN